jgi:hypothetical protein
MSSLLVWMGVWLGEKLQLAEPAVDYQRAKTLLTLRLYAALYSVAHLPPPPSPVVFSLSSGPFFSLTRALQRNLDLCVLRKGIARPVPISTFMCL